jgi:hypothetical protein
MRRQHDFGMRGRDGRIEDRSQQGTSVGHGHAEKVVAREPWLSIQSAQKKTPADCPRGFHGPSLGRLRLPDD